MAVGVSLGGVIDGVGIGLVVPEGDGRGVVGGVGFGLGVAEGSGVSLGLGLALGLGVARARDDGLGVVFFLGLVVFRFLRDGVGVGVPTKKSFTFSVNDSSFSSVARTGAATANAASTTIKTRNVLFISKSGRQFLEHSLIHPDARVEILQRKILIGRMRTAVWQSQSKQKRFYAENISEIGDDRNAAAFANERDVFFENFFQGTRRRLHKF